jgi:low affinity Fe/Cu permease
MGDPSGKHSSVFSRALHWIDTFTARAWLAALLSLVTLTALTVLLALARPTTELTVFATVIQAITLLMVFVVQHTQQRDQQIMNRKLDELLLANRQTDAGVVYLESATDDEIDEIARRHRSRGERKRA